MASCRHLPPLQVVLASREYPSQLHPRLVPIWVSHTWYSRCPAMTPNNNCRGCSQVRPLRGSDNVSSAPRRLTFESLLSNLLSTISFIPFHVLPHLEANGDAHTIRSYTPRYSTRRSSADDLQRGFVTVPWPSAITLKLVLHVK